MSWTDRLTSWLAPTPPPEAPDAPSVPPALSAAASSPPATVTAARNAPALPEWQERAWTFYRHLGEARRSVDWIAGGASRCHLFIGEYTDDGRGDPEPVDNPAEAGEILAELTDGVGTRDLLYRMAVHLLVPGETWMVGYPRPRDRNAPERDEDSGTAWTVLSRREWAIDDDGTIRLKLPDHPKRDEGGWVAFRARQVVMVRLHDPDPEDADRSTSAFEAALPVLEELAGLDDRVMADIRSRLAGAGIYEVPESATMPNPGMSDSVGTNPLNGSPFVQGLMHAASTAIKDPESPSAVVPLVVTTSDEAAGKSKHHTFATPFDAQVPVLREDARKRLASVMDIPGEVIQGIESLNHWSAWQSDISAIKAHIGPLLSMICTGVTRKILWPALKAAGKDDAEIRTLAVWWDATEIILRPDRSTESIEAFKLKAISGEALRRELGFAEEDAPTAEEQNRELGLDKDGNPLNPAADQQQPDHQIARRDGGQKTPSARPEQPQGSGGKGTSPAPPK